ncbi:hypothetical protein N431DRAFT_431620 [Stipitochalara longipes BDJ]|nr:hypothetical protein N431DRAFT_431620 [Stipitochalara longipes BDJ]
MEGAPSGSRAAGKSNSKGSAKGKDSTSTSTKPKATPTSSGQRFQCPRCPKNFSRIENLTRHQANHEEQGKFACPICRKRFTRSDLLNRHRRIHGNQQEPKGHVTQGDYSGSAGPGFDNLVARRSTSQDGSSNLSTLAPNNVYQTQIQPQGLTYAYQNPFQQNQVPGHHSTMLNTASQAQGLTSLMEAALAPQVAAAFTPGENINPLLWDGFMRFGEKNSSYMGIYDADMSWTLDYLPTEQSPNYLLEDDLMNTFDDFGDNPYQFQSLQYEPPPPPNENDSGEDEEDTTDWPDKVSRPEGPQRRAPRVVPVQHQLISWEPVLQEARASGLSPATIRPLDSVNDDLRELMLSSLNGPNFRNDISRPEISDAMFPPAEALDFFIRLYIRYVQPRFPVLHLPTFDLYNSSPLLLITMMFVGSSHSTTDRGRFSRLFHEHLRIAIIRIQEIDKKFLRSVDNVLTYFLLCLAGTWSGSKNSYEFAEGGRGILVTACRRCRLLDCRPSASVEIESHVRPGVTQLDAAWLAWVETEKRKRLGLSIYIYDCQYPTLFNNQPYVSKAETTNCAFPCAAAYWDAPTAESWKMAVGPADIPPVTFYLHALNSCLLRKWIKPPPPVVPTSEFGKIVLMYALHTHIFEWRQSTSMLNPTGLQGTFGNVNSAYDIGEGLRERRRWLKDGLDSFAECYGGPGTSAGAALLLQLGYVALDVSLSDMHLVAGRSSNNNDASFAGENLKYWANSEIADSTMSHIYTMLELCHHCINIGAVADSSYEVAVCLFTGGMVCWAFAKLRLGLDVGEGGRKEQYMEQVRKASAALRQMGCWRMCSMFGTILATLEAKSSQVGA